MPYGALQCRSMPLIAGGTGTGPYTMHAHGPTLHCDAVQGGPTWEPVPHRCGAVPHSETRRYLLSRFLRGHDRIDLEIDDVAPACDPLIEQSAIVCLHHLETAFEPLIDPARNIA